jgi:hypothetical protein
MRQESLANRLMCYVKRPSSKTIWVMLQKPSLFV